LRFRYLRLFVIDFTHRGKCNARANSHNSNIIYFERDGAHSHDNAAAFAEKWEHPNKQRNCVGHIFDLLLYLLIYLQRVNKHDAFCLCASNIN